MKTIYKYQLKLSDAQTIKMPKGARILCVQSQFDLPCLWAEVDKDAERIDRTFEVFGTGHPIDNANREYIGTCQMMHGNLVWHVYESK